MYRILFSTSLLLLITTCLLGFTTDSGDRDLNMQEATNEVNVFLDILGGEPLQNILQWGQDATVEVLMDGRVYQSFYYSEQQDLVLGRRNYQIVIRSQNFLNYYDYLNLVDEPRTQITKEISLTLAPRHGVNFEIVDGRGDAVDGATITFNGSVLSGLRVDDLPVGTYSYRVEKRNYRTVQDSVYISGPMTIRVELELITYRVTFSVKNSYNEDVTGVSITAGGVRFSGLQGWLPAGSYNYTISKQGYPSKTGSFRVSGTTSVPVTGYDPANHYLPSSNHTFRCAQGQRKQLRVRFIRRDGTSTEQQSIQMGRAQHGSRDLFEITIGGIIRDKRQSASNLKWVIVTEQ